MYYTLVVKIYKIKLSTALICNRVDSKGWRRLKYRYPDGIAVMMSTGGIINEWRNRTCHLYSKRQERLQSRMLKLWILTSTESTGYLTNLAGYTLVRVIYEQDYWHIWTATTLSFYNLAQRIGLMRSVLIRTWAQENGNSLLSAALLAISVLDNHITMAHRKTTSRRVATKASRLLRSRRSSPRVKSVAGSALSQKHGRGRR